MIISGGDRCIQSLSVLSESLIIKFPFDAVKTLNNHARYWF